MFTLADLDDGDLPLSTAPSDSTPSAATAAALNYSALAATAAMGGSPLIGQDAVSIAGGLGGLAGTGGVGGGISSTETLLRNIQGLLKVAADNARQQERQINYEKGTNSNMVYLLSLAQYYMYLAATQKC